MKRDVSVTTRKIKLNAKGVKALKLESFLKLGGLACDLKELS